MDDNVKSFVTLSLYSIKRNLFLVSFALVGFGNHFLGVALPVEFTTFFIFIVLVLQIISGSFKFSKFLLIVFIYVAIQTFLLNITNLSEPKVWSHFLGLTILAMTIFSFVSFNRFNLCDFVVKYYNLVYYVSVFSIFQLGIFLLFGISIIPQNIVTGHFQTGSSEFIPEVFGILPRNLGLSSEPANFAYILIPGVYLACLHLIKKVSFIRSSRLAAWLILLAMLLTFSLVGYFGILLSVVFILKDKIFKSLYSLALIVVLIYGIFVSSVGEKFLNLIQLGKEVSEGNFQTYTPTSFALISNGLISLESQKDNKYIGSGLNTHQYNYEKYYDVYFDQNLALLQLNKENGGSMFIRLLSEFGIPGLLFCFIFFINFKLKHEKIISNYQIVNEMALVTILLFCIRSGSYTSITVLIFVALYCYSYWVEKSNTKKYASFAQVRKFAKSFSS